MPGSSYRLLQAFCALALACSGGHWMGDLFYTTGEQFLHPSSGPVLTVAHQATAFNMAGLVVCRVGLGVFEAGFGPAIPLYLCEPPFHPIFCPRSHALQHFFTPNMN